LPLRVEGGTRHPAEKYRHSQNGRTGSLADKLQQMVGASLKVYREAPTRALRREIILTTSTRYRSPRQPAMAKLTD
jgi:hypothetical protein